MLTVGHGTLPAEELAALLRGAGVRLVVDVRRYPGSRRHPHVGRAQLERWLPGTGIAYRWDEALGGRRAALPDSPNQGLRNPQFRGYADHMATPAFRAAVDRLLADGPGTAVLCAESLWWRCHRRLIADHLVLVGGTEVRHLLHDGRLAAHEPTVGAQRAEDHIVYAPAARTLPGLA